MNTELADLSQRTFLLGIGAHKAGTTWLHHYLDYHPQIYMAPVKEMHFFGNRFEPEDSWPITHFRRRLRERKAKSGENSKAFKALRARIRMGGDMKLYRRFFRYRVQDEQVFGEITPAYSMLEVKELEYARSRFPKIRIIFLMRNPVDRLWSHMRFSEDFDTVEELEAMLPRILRKPAYRERIDYALTLRNLEQVFDKREVHYEFYENLFTDAAVKRICDFLEVDTVPANFDKKLNVSVKAPLSPLLRPEVVKSLRGQYDAVIERFGEAVPKNWHADLALVSGEAPAKSM